MQSYKENKYVYISYRNCLHSRIHSCHDPKHEQEYIKELLFLRSCNGLVVQHWRVDITQWDTMNTIELAITQWNKKNRTSHQAKLPTSATNLSKSFAPAQLTPAQNITVINLKMFFSHFTRGSSLPLCEKIPFSIIRTAGKSCNGTERRMANEYKNCTYDVRWDKCKGRDWVMLLTAWTNLLSESRLVMTTVWISGPKARYARTPAPPKSTLW